MVFSTPKQSVAAATKPKNLWSELRRYMVFELSTAKRRRKAERSACELSDCDRRCLPDGLAMRLCTTSKLNARTSPGFPHTVSRISSPLGASLLDLSQVLSACACVCIGALPVCGSGWLYEFVFPPTLFPLRNALCSTKEEPKSKHHRHCPGANSLLFEPNQIYSNTLEMDQSSSSFIFSSSLWWLYSSSPTQSARRAPILIRSSSRSARMLAFRRISR